MKICLFNLTSIIDSIDLSLIAFVYQIRNYRALIKFNLSQATSQNILVLINSIITRYSRSSQSESDVSITRDIKRSKFIESLIFSENWVIDKSQLLSNIKRFYNNCVEYRIFSDYFSFKDQIHEDLINVFLKNFSDFVEIISNKFSLKSRLLRASKFERFISVDSLLSIKFSNLKQESFNATSIMSRSTVSDSSSQSTVSASFNDEISWSIFKKKWKTMLNSMQTMQTVLQINAANTTIRDQRHRSEEATSSNNDNSKWNVAELKFFDSMYDNKSINIDQVMKHTEKDIYFRKIHLFLNRVKDMTIIHDDQFIRENLFICLKSAALQWYIFELSTETKELLRYEQNLKYWTDQLLKRFKKSSNVFIITILKERYTMNDVRRRRKFREYAFIILRAAKSTDMKFVTNQIAIIYNELDLEFQRNLIRFENVSSLNTFLREINDFKHIWWSLISRNKLQLFSQSSYERYQDNYSYNYNQFEERFMKEATKNRNYRRENSYSQNQSTKRYRNSYYNSDNYNNFNEKNSVYESNRYIQNSFFNQAYQSQNHNYSNRNQSQTYAFVFASQQDFSYQFESFYQFDIKNKQNISFDNQRSSQASDSQAQSYFQRVFSKSFTSSSDQTTKQKAYYTTDDIDKYEDYEKQENVYNDFENTKESYHENYIQEEEISYKNEKNDISQNFFVDALNKFNLSYDCRKCNRNFSFKNAFHRHLKTCLLKIDLTKFSTNNMLFEIVFSNFIFIIEFCFNINIKTWHFLTVKINIDIKSTINDLCIDTDCETFMTNRSFISTMISNYASKIKVIASFKVRNIENAIVSSIETIVLDFSFSEVINEAFAVAKLFKKIRIVDNLLIKILIEMNIINLEKMTINANTLIINSCKNIKIDLSAIFKNDSVKKIVICALTTTISSHINMNVAIKLRKRHELSSRDYMFHSQRHIALDREKEVFSHIVNSKFFKIMIINSFNQFVILSKRCRLSVIKKFEKKECYIAFEYDAHFATNNWNDASKLKIRTMLADSQTITFEMITFDASKIVIDSDIIIYDTNSNQDKIRQVAKVYLKLWSNDDDATMKISENDWMSINLLFDAKILIAKVYSIEFKDKHLIDEMFNKLHKQKRMKYIKYSTAHDYSIFVIWRIILKSEQKSVRKDRVVIDIRELNKITETDNYLMSLQTNITSAMTECKYISVFDAAIFFINETFVSRINLN